VANGEKYPSGTKRTAVGAVLIHRPGGAGERVGNGLLGASGSEKLTVTLVLKAASPEPGVGETEVILSGGGGRVVVDDCDGPVFDDPGPSDEREWLACSATAVTTPPMATRSAMPIAARKARSYGRFSLAFL